MALGGFVAVSDRRYRLRQRQVIAEDAAIAAPPTAFSPPSLPQPMAAPNVALADPGQGRGE
jgi:hypothetical protein